MNTRLKQFLAAENITQSQFADKIEVVRASVSHVLSGRNNPSYEFIKAIMSKYPTLNMEWLIFGKGKMYKDINSETSLPPYHQAEVTTEDPQKEEGLYGDLFHGVELQQTQVEAIIEEQPDPQILPEKHLTEKIQIPSRQRKVIKIIVLFDDGSYQEL